MAKIFHTERNKKMNLTGKTDIGFKKLILYCTKKTRRRKNNNSDTNMPTVSRDAQNQLKTRGHTFFFLFFFFFFFRTVLH